jgi:hypothetical protein
MPVCTRSLHTFATNILNNIVDNVDNVVNHPTNTNNKEKEKIQTNDDDASKVEFGCCSVCLDEIQSEKGRFVLECGHTFHAKCILLEFQHRNRCPMCRTEVKESAAHEQRFMMPTSLRIYSSILHDAADHFIHDLGNITFANVIHRMMLLSSEDQELRSVQYPYIKRLLVQFASMLIRGVAFSVRDHDSEIQDPVPIDIVDNMMDVDNDSEYDAAISNPAVDAAVAYQAIVTTDMNFDSPSHNDNVSSALIRRSVALAAMGSQRADLSLRRASRLALRRQQFEEVRRLLQEAVVGEREREREQVAAVTVNQSQPEQNVNMVISENQNPVEENDDDGANPWGIQF